MSFVYFSVYTLCILVYTNLWNPVAWYSKQH